MDPFLSVTMFLHENSLTLNKLVYIRDYIYKPWCIGLEIEIGKRQVKFQLNILTQHEEILILQK